MLHDDLYTDMDPDYHSRVFLARRRLVESVEGPSRLPDSGLSARGLLNDSQLALVSQIRTRRLSRVMDRFARD